MIFVYVPRRRILGIGSDLVHFAGCEFVHRSRDKKKEKTETVSKTVFLFFSFVPGFLFLVIFSQDR